MWGYYRLVTEFDLLGVCMIGCGREAPLNAAKEGLAGAQTGHPQTCRLKQATLPASSRYVTLLQHTPHTLRDTAGRPLLRAPGRGLGCQTATPTHRCPSAGLGGWVGRRVPLAPHAPLAASELTQRILRCTTIPASAARSRASLHYHGATPGQLCGPASTSKPVRNRTWSQPCQRVFTCQPARMALRPRHHQIPCPPVQGQAERRRSLPWSCGLGAHALLGDPCRHARSAALELAALPTGQSTAQLKPVEGCIVWCLLVYLAPPRFPLCGPVRRHSGASRGSTPGCRVGWAVSVSRNQAKARQNLVDLRPCCALWRPVVPLPPPLHFMRASIPRPLLNW